MKNICVFLGASQGNNPNFQLAAESLGKAIADHQFSLVYGGSKTGLMGLLADSAMVANGKVTGVTVQTLKDKEFHHEGLDQLHITEDMNTRKQMMNELSDAFIIFPGGCGTYDEFFDVFTWAKLGFHKKPIIILNLEGYYEPLLSLLTHTEEQDFMNSWDMELIQVAASIEECIRLLKSAS